MMAHRASWSIMEYYGLRNLQSDTDMRKSIATSGMGGTNDHR
jgi:uncharacterized protein YqfA (UPF0365 family)